MILYGTACRCKVGSVCNVTKWACTIGNVCTHVKSKFQTKTPSGSHCGIETYCCLIRMVFSFPECFAGQLGRRYIVQTFAATEQ